MKYRDELKIELRAVPFSSDSHVLEWRISPNQDLRYLEDEIEKSWLGFVKKMIHKVKKYNTLWHQPKLFSYPITMYLYDFNYEFNWGPIWCENKKCLEDYRAKFKTYGDLRKYIEEHTNKSYEKWKAERDAYLKRMQPIY